MSTTTVPTTIVTPADPADPAPVPAAARSRRPRDRMLRREGSRRSVDVIVLTAAVGVALLPLLPVYGSTSAVVPAVGGLVLGAALALVAARLRWGAMVTAAAGVGVYLLAGSALATRDAAAGGGLVPTRQSLLLLLTGAVTVWKQVLTLDPVLGTSGNLLVAPYLLALVATALAVGVALRAKGRRGVWAALVPPAVLALAVLLGTKETVAPDLAGVILAALLVAWAAWRRGTLAVRRPVALVVMAAVAASAGGLAGPLLADLHPRFVLRDELVPPFDPRDQASPLSSFRKFVKDWKDTDLLTVSGLPEGARIRLATMDAFDGVVWNVAGAGTAEGSGSFRRVGDTIRTSVRGPVETIRMEALHLPFVWLPTVGYAQSLTFEGAEAADLEADLRYDDATGAAVLTHGVPAGTRWTTTVVVPPTPDDDAIGAAAVGPQQLPKPTGVPDAVPLFAGEIAGTATSPVLIARSLQAGLAERGWFSHGIAGSGDYPSLSGHGADRITTLLTADVMVGDGEQYASAMALMARQMGLPARVVLGFIPAKDQQGGDPVTITGGDVQAWVEISFAGYGWVAFDPTPDESKTPRQDTPQQQAQPQPQVMQPPPPPQDPVQPPDEDTEQPRTSDRPEQPVVDSPWRAVATAALAAGVPLVVVLGPLALITALKRRRRRRRRTATDPVRRVVGAWDELLDEARDMRRPPPATATRREVAVSLADTFAQRRGRRASRRPTDGRRRGPSVGRPMATLAAGADEIVFGPGQPTDEQVERYWAQVDETVAVMRSMLPVRHRWRAAWSTVSLRSPRRGRLPGSRSRRLRRR
ncbi:MAG TPA: transglutaminase-like domain-containing protein [Actinotalea sp.]